ncbi:MAG TPA: GMP synthase subunit A [Thermoplasmata archaeon]|nr:GMP synthase subunit A [Thermoplasmata archaeon]
MRVPVIDNGGQWTHREYRVLRDLDAETEIVANTTPWEGLGRPDGIVLSGGALSLEGTAELGQVGRWIDEAPVPVLAICVGHQFLARHYGGQVAKAATPEFGRVEVQREGPEHPLFAGLPPRFTAWESHNDEVRTLPPGWHRLARSEACAVQAMVHPSRPVFGLQFHPEVEHTEGGRRLFSNFLALCASTPGPVK